MEKSIQFAGTWGSNRTLEFSASTERPIMPRNNGLTIIADDQIWCELLVATGV